MRFKFLLGGILFIIGLSAGVYQWISAGLTGALPVLGLILIFVGLYLMVSDLATKKKPKKTIAVDKELLTTAGLLAAVVGGLVTIEMFKKRQSSMSNEEILQLERDLEQLRSQGRITETKYRELKAIIQEVKRRRGLG